MGEVWQRLRRRCRKEINILISIQNKMMRLIEEVKWAQKKGYPIDKLMLSLNELRMKHIAI